MGLFDRLFGKKKATKTDDKEPQETKTEDMDYEIKCEYCGQPISIHELANKTARKLKQNGKTVYLHKKCWRKIKNEAKHRGFAAFK